ncbi:MAG: hypothetical protein U0793_14045 [Gemmataceae bacterium]
MTSPAQSTSRHEERRDARSACDPAHATRITHLPFPFHPARGPAPTSPEPRPAPSGFWLAFLGLTGFALALVAWGAWRQVNAEKSLREGRLASTLDLVVAEAKKPAPRLETEPIPPKHKEEPPLPAPPPVEPPPLVRTEAIIPPPPPLPEPPRKLEPPKIDVTPRIDVPAKIELPPVPPPMLVAPPVELPPVDLPVIPSVEAPKPVPPPAAAPQEVDEYPLVFTRASASGETPMLRNWKMLAVYSLTVVVVSQPAPVVAQDELGKRLDKIEASLKKSFEDLGGDVGSLKNQLTKLQVDVAALQLDSKVRIDALESQVAKLQKEIDGLRKRLDSDLTRVGSSPIDKAGFDDVKARLEGIEKAIRGLTPPASRTALSPGAAPGAAGRVMFVNNYPEELLLVLNGRNFRVAPMTTLPIDGVPAGSLNYEVISPTWGLRARRSAALAGGETFTLTAN